jgi:hypothetical protein
MYQLGLVRQAAVVIFALKMEPAVKGCAAIMICREFWVALGFLNSSGHPHRGFQPYQVDLGRLCRMLSRQIVRGMPRNSQSVSPVVGFGPFDADLQALKLRKNGVYRIAIL